MQTANHGYYMQTADNAHILFMITVRSPWRKIVTQLNLEAYSAVSILPSVWILPAVQMLSTVCTD